MHCPKCQSSQNNKNGFRAGKQSYKWKNCGCRYVKNPISRKYPVEVKQLCLKVYLNGMGFRAIARVTEINHTTLINLVKEAGASLSDERQEEEIPEIAEIDELYASRYPLGQTFVGNKRNQLWIWTVFSPITSQDFVLLQINSSSQIFYSPIVALFKIQQCRVFYLKHYALTNAQIGSLKMVGDKISKITFVAIAIALPLHPSL